MLLSQVGKNAWTLSIEGVPFVAHTGDAPFALALRREKTYESDRGTVKEHVVEAERIALTDVAQGPEGVTLSGDGHSLHIQIVSAENGADLLFTGVDHYYYLAGQYGTLYADFPETGIPIDERVARHICGIVQLCGAYNELGNDLAIDLGDLPSYREIMTTGIGVYLDPTD